METVAEVNKHNEAEIRSCLNDIANSAIVMGKVPEAKIGMAIIWLKQWSDSNSKSSLYNYAEKIRDFVLDDVPHRYQDRLLKELDLPK